MGQPSAFPICLSPPSSGHPALPGNTHTLQYDSGLVAHLPSWACLPAIPEACGSQTTAGGGRRLENMDTRAAPEPQQPRLTIQVPPWKHSETVSCSPNWSQFDQPCNGMGGGRPTDRCRLPLLALFASNKDLPPIEVFSTPTSCWEPTTYYAK